MVPNGAMAAVLLTALALAAGSAAQEEAPAQAPAPVQDTISPAEPTKDLFDAPRELLRHKPPPPPGPEDYKKWMIAVARASRYGPTSGVGIGVAGNVAFTGASPTRPASRRSSPA